MTLQQITYLLALAEKASFTAAATACHVTQPTLTIMIRQLEEELGIALVDRSERHIRLTKAGTEVAAHGRRMLEEASSIRAVALERSTQATGLVRLAVIPTLAPTLVPPLLTFLRNLEHWEATLHVHELTTAAALHALHHDDVDVILAAIPVHERFIEEHSIADEPFVAYLPADSPLLAGTTVHAAALRSEHLLLLDDGHCFREQALRICGIRASAHGLSLRTSSLDMLARLVDAGHGATLLPMLAAANVAHPARLRPIDGPAAARRIGVLHRSSYGRSRVVRTLVEALTSITSAAGLSTGLDVRQADGRRLRST